MRNLWVVVVYCSEVATTYCSQHQICSYVVLLSSGEDVPVSAQTGDKAVDDVDVETAWKTLQSQSSVAARRCAHARRVDLCGDSRSRTCRQTDCPCRVADLSRSGGGPALRGASGRRTQGAWRERGRRPLLHLPFGKPEPGSGQGDGGDRVSRVSQRRWRFRRTARRWQASRCRSGLEGGWSALAAKLGARPVVGTGHDCPRRSC